MNSKMRVAVLAGLSILLLSGCQSAKQKAMCPTANVLANTATLTKFKPGMENDPAGAQFTIQITGVRTSCDVDLDEGTTDSAVEITFRATRAPTGDTANFTAPFFVASLVDATTIMNKKILATAFTFQPGEASITFTETVPSTVIKFENGKKPYEYALLVGLQLTREELNYNANAGRYAP